MGPAPLGFVKKIINGLPWIWGIVLRSALRLRIANKNLVAVIAGNDVYMVSFISTLQLDTGEGSLDLQWIVCGRRSGSGSSYDFKDEADPDNLMERNSVHPLVLDGYIVRLNGGRGCDSWLRGLRLYNRLQAEVEQPQSTQYVRRCLRMGSVFELTNPGRRRSVRLYMLFINGQSAACLESNCNEAAVYRNMPLHCAAECTADCGNSIDFLSGTVLNNRVPMLSATKLNLYSNLIGVLRMYK